MKYRSKTEHQRQFLPVVVVLSNNILPVWYLRQVHDSERPNFQFPQETVEIELSRAYAMCKRWSKGPEQQIVIWVVDVETQVHTNELQGVSRAETVTMIQSMYEEMEAEPHVKMIINNPTFELWLQLHFERLSRGIEINGEEVKARVEHYIPGYVRERSFFHEGETIYAKTRNSVAIAMINANGLIAPDFPDLKLARTMMPVAVSLFKEGV